MFILAEQLFSKTTETEKHVKKIGMNANDWGASARYQDNKSIQSNYWCLLQMILIIKLS